MQDQTISLFGSLIQDKKIENYMQRVTIGIKPNYSISDNIDIANGIRVLQIKGC